MSDPLSPTRLADIRDVHARSGGQGWEEAYRIDVGLLLAEVERLSLQVEAAEARAALHEAVAAAMPQRAAWAAADVAKIDADGEANRAALAVVVNRMRL